MTDRIEPVMTPEQWAAVRSGADDLTHYYFTGELTAAIAAINDELEDDDPHKITREWIWRLRKAADCVQAMEGMRKTVNPLPNAQWEGDRYRTFADALESYLPPD